MLKKLLFILICCGSASGFQVPSILRTGHAFSLFPSRSVRNEDSTSLILHRLDSGPSWDGDDIRWITRQGRRLRKFNWKSSTPVCESILIANVLIYLWQVLSTLNHLRVKFPTYWRTDASSMIYDSIIDGTRTVGPFTSDFMFSSLAASRQPHRFLTSGFLHGSILDLSLNMYVLRQLPSWIENGLGWPLMITTYLFGIIGGNYYYSTSIEDNMMISLGSQGGVMALAGLSFVALTKMRKKPEMAKLLPSISIFFVLGLILPTMSNTISFGGFLSGCLMGSFFSPGYSRSYGQRRKNAIDVDFASPDYRRAMGFGIIPNEKPPLQLRIFWALVLSCLVWFPHLRQAPSMFLKGLINPGYLSGWKN